MEEDKKLEYVAKTLALQYYLGIQSTSISAIMGKAKSDKLIQAVEEDWRHFIPPAEVLLKKINA